MKILIVLGVAVLLNLLVNWYVMLLVGMIHFNILPAVIPASYWSCFPISFLLSGIIAVNAGSND